MDEHQRARERRAAANGDGELFENLASPPPSFRAVSGSGGTPASNGVSLDDLILRRRAPDDAARAAPTSARGTIFSPPQSPPRGSKGSRGSGAGETIRGIARRRRRR